MSGPFTLAQIASQLGGRVDGNPAVLIRQVGSLGRAGQGQIAFFSNPRNRAELAATHASAVVLGPEAEALTPLPRIERWPRISAPAPMVQWLPMSALPATAAQPAIAVCAPIRQLCPIWT